MSQSSNKMLEHLSALYGDEIGRATLAQLQVLMGNARRSSGSRKHSAVLTERDAILITYGDQVRAPNTAPLATLADFCEAHLRDIVSNVHILPFYPYTSDDGFSVVDYRAVNPAFGTWNDLARMGAHFRLMFDAVINHISASSTWFQGFLRDEPRYRNYFIVVPAGVDLSQVVRPRTLPLLTEFTTPRGKKNVWTTFSADQIDLNYRNPNVLLDVLEALLFYIAHGAEFIRLDAIAFLWKEFGTPCLHLPQTHHVIQLIRAMLDEVAPHVTLITETNVPHDDNISYFGDGTNEAQMVYNFALPPLLLYTFHAGDATALAQWVNTLRLPSQCVTFFNFLASHDGIGLNPARGILSDAQVDMLVARTLAHAGFVSYKNNPDGTSSPYELNINYFDALSNPNADESLDLQVDRFIAAQAIMLALVGVPGIYFHSLFGSRSWREGVAQTGQNRTINREKLECAELERDLSDTQSRRYRVFTKFAQLLRVRAAHPAFNPYGGMRALEGGQGILSLLRGDSPNVVLCLQNVSAVHRTIEWDIAHVLGSHHLTDLITGDLLEASQARMLSPYESRWLARSDASKASQ